MPATPRHCPICQELLIEVEAALNGVFLGRRGTRVLDIRLPGKDWVPFMTPDRAARGLYCAECGALTIAPTLSAHRRELGLEP